jgi:hypothetical protein
MLTDDGRMLERGSSFLARSSSGFRRAGPDGRRSRSIWTTGMKPRRFARQLIAPIVVGA